MRSGKTYKNKKTSKTKKPLSIKAKIFAACVPCIAVVIALIMLLSSGSIAEAYASLPHIESIIARLESGVPFTILEIAEDTDNGFFGHYIQGQESGVVGRWESVMSGIGSSTGREAYAAQMVSDLHATGVMGDAALGDGEDDYPLTWEDTYTEFPPWERTDGMRSLRLQANDPVIPVNGIAAEAPGNSGEYTAVFNFTAVDEGAFSGNAEELFELVTGGVELYGAGRYYFNPVFAEVIIREPYLDYDPGTGAVDLPVGTPIYTSNDEYAPSAYYFYKIYDYNDPFGTYDPDDGPFYIITDYGTASDDNIGHPYAMRNAFDVNTSFIPYPYAGRAGFPSAGAKFTRTVTDLIYTGSNGTFNFTPDTNGPAVYMHYDVVFYNGGFINNHWFLRYVFDRDPQASNLNHLSNSLRVSTIRADSVSASDIENADMIVLNGDIVSLSMENAINIYNRSLRANGFIPVMFDYNLSAGADPAGLLTQSLASKPRDAALIAADGTLPGGTVPFPGNGVNDNIFWTVKGTRDLFDIYDASLYTAFGSPFYDVYVEIVNENFLRAGSGDAAIPDIITDAAAIRYIINFGNQREMVEHERIVVLELQGGNYGSADDTRNKVMTWLSDPTVDIDIVQMTTYEFIGSLENLNEKYHMLYIGGSASGMNDVNGESKYNDRIIDGDKVEAYMNGLVYTNIGDIYRVNNDVGSGQALSGLVAGDDDRWFRLSGNDITPEKYQAILDFAAAGYPVIIDDRLIRGIPQMPSSPCPACGSTTQWDNANLPNWGGGVGAWLQCGGSPPGGGYCGLQFEHWGGGAGITNNNHWGHAEGTYPIPEDAFYNTPSNPLEINTNRVDNCSYMYRALNAIKDRPNVYSEYTASLNSTLVTRYVNLSKPELIIDIKPRDYSMSDDGIMNCFRNGCRCVDGEECTGISGNTNTFSFEIWIRNITDPTPHLTTFNVELFFDLNGDGRYSPDEKQTDILVNRGNIQQSEGKFHLVATARNQEPVKYTIDKQMPVEAVGLYDWCLRITHNSNSGIRASHTGYTRITPNPDDDNSVKTINILQIASDLVAGDVANNFAADSFGFKGNQQRVNFEWQQRKITDYTQTINSTRGILRDGTTVNPYHSSGEPPSDARAANEYLRGKDGITYYEGIYGRLIADVDDFEINIYTMYAREVHSRGTLEAAINNRRLPANGIPYIETATGNYLYTCGLAEINADGRYVIADDVDLDDIFQAFDMLIIGFDDSYGYMSKDTAEAVANYIESGRATLFAHDAVTYYANRSGVDAYGMEASFILRNATNLDRYGLTNSELFPVSPYNGNSLGAWGDSIINNIIEAGYAVGWTPKSNRTSTVRDIQGYNSHVFKWYNYENRSGNRNETGEVNTGNGTEGNPFRTFMNRSFGEIWGSANVSNGIGRRTTRITQLNEGKITTYPYDLNFVDFSTPQSFNNTRGNYRDVGGTHGQWHTVNMSKDDIVVWYCLNSDYYIHNDAANSYYIYNSGNVTYTGAGHSMTQGNTTGRNTSRNSTHPFRNGMTNQFNTYGIVATTSANAEAEGSSAAAPNGWLLTAATEYEAMLFVNTMIAAYRAANEPPSITITDERGTPLGGWISENVHRFAYSLLPADDTTLANSSVLATDRINDENRIVHFTISDGNLATPKYIYLSVSFVGEYDPLPRPLEPFLDDDENIINPITYENLPVYVRGAEGIPANNRNGQLQSGIPYWFRLPEEVITILNSTDSSGNYRPVTMRLEAMTDFTNRNRELKGYADLVIRRVELFNLS